MNNIFDEIKGILEGATLEELRVLAVDEYSFQPQDRSKEELVDAMLSIEQTNYYK